MLIIFDLDDTLIDTSGSVTPVKLQDALKVLIQAGLQVESFNEAFNRLLQLDMKAPSAADALEEFLGGHLEKERFLDIGVQEMYSSLKEELHVMPMAHASEVLGMLQDRHTLALASIGHLPQQMWKMEKAGIDSNIFSKIAVGIEKDKKRLYQRILEELNVPPCKGVVCGDRIERDLIPARQLGFKTVQMLWGRGLRIKKYVENPDYAIHSLSELPSIIASLETS